MSLFEALPIAGSGMDAMQTWIDTSAGNIANIGDAAPVGSRPYAAQTPVLAPAGPTAVSGLGPGEGVAVTGIALGTARGEVAYEPADPLANAAGDVVLPHVSLAAQMVDMIQAQESYQADTVALARAQSAYTAGLSIGT